jgi:Glycoside-hydrolase family GH114
MGRFARMFLLVGRVGVSLAFAAALAGGARADEPPVPAPVGCEACYVPAVATSFQVQLGGGQVKIDVPARLFAIDWQSDRSVVAGLKARGRKVFCYISVGSWEDFRPDKGSFPSAVMGNTYGGYPDERWLDVRRIDVLEPIMVKRMLRCKRSGFDGVWFDNVDGFEQGTGCRISAVQQLTYNATLANDAHGHGLSAAFNNDPTQALQMVPYFDWVLYEADRSDVGSCFYRRSCHTLQPFHDAGKATFVIEYRRSRKEIFCRIARRRGFNGIIKDLNLTAYRVACPLPPD